MLRKDDAAVVIGLSLPLSLITRLNSEARRRNVSRSRLVRILVEKALEAELDAPRRDGRWTVLEP